MQPRPDETIYSTVDRIQCRGLPCSHDQPALGRTYNAATTGLNQRRGAALTNHDCMSGFADLSHILTKCHRPAVLKGKPHIIAAALADLKGKLHMIQGSDAGKLPILFEYSAAQRLAQYLQFVLTKHICIYYKNNILFNYLTF